MDVQTSAGGMAKTDFSEFPEDLIPALDETYDLGEANKRWQYLFAVIAILTSLTIGGVIGLSNVDSWLFINASTYVNGSLNVSEDLFVNGTLTAGNVNISNLTIEDMNFENLTLTGDIFNISATETYVNDLFPNEYCTSDLGSIGLRWDNGFFCHNVSAEYFIGDGSFLTGLPTGDNSSWNESYANTLYATLAQILAFNYYNSTDFSISDYFTSAQILGFGYYNSSDFSISDYLTSTQILGFNYWNSTHADFNKTYADTLYLTSYTETDPLWSGNETNVAFKNEANVFTADQSLTGQNISAINCIVFDSGGEICSGS